jgi:hypothetical protein
VLWKEKDQSLRFSDGVLKLAQGALQKEALADDQKVGAIAARMGTMGYNDTMEHIIRATAQ